MKLRAATVMAQRLLAIRSIIIFDSKVHWEETLKVGLKLNLYTRAARFSYIAFRILHTVESSTSFSLILQYFGSMRRLNLRMLATFGEYGVEAMGCGLHDTLS